jgi:hypothetical protein
MLHYGAQEAGNLAGSLWPGGRFLMTKSLTAADTASRPSIVVVQNWFAELKARMPARP